MVQHLNLHDESSMAAQLPSLSAILNTQLYESRKEGEEEEIRIYRDIITSSLEELRPEIINKLRIYLT
jgi:hypothetical protein